MIRYSKAITLFLLVCTMCLAPSGVFAGNTKRQDAKWGELDNMKIGENEEGDSVMEVGPRPDIDMTPREDVPIVVQPYIGTFPPGPVPRPGSGPGIRSK